MSVSYYGPEGYDGKERFQHFLDNPPVAISVDVETISLTERMAIGFAIAFSATEAIYFQVHPEAPKELELLKPLLFNPKVTKIAHNMMFDLSILPTIPHLDGFDRTNLWDTNVAARLLGRNETALTILASEVNMEVRSAKDMLQSGQTMLDLDSADLAEKCQMDARAAFALYQSYLPQIQEQYGSGYFDIEMEVIPILIDLSLRGIAIDQQARADMESRYEDDVEFYRRQLEEYGISKPGSTQQVGYTLATRGNFLPFTRSKKQLSTKVSELEFLDDPMAAAVLGWRKKSKFLNTYIKPIAGQDRFYTEYYLDTSVGRMNSRNRNIQNIPAEARLMLLPDSGVFTTGDYSREHMFILAEMSQDRDMLRILRDPDPEKNDIHMHTARMMGIPRSIAKTVNYAILYGATPKTISEQTKIKDIARCSRLLDGWLRTYKGAADWITSVQRESLRTGWAAPTVFGRKIRIPEESKDGMERKAMNYPVLGSDGEIIKRAIILCRDKGLGPTPMAITVHDSITFDGDVELPVEELEMIPGFRIPFEVKQTLRWE